MVEIADPAGAIQGSFKVESPLVALKAFTQYVDRFLEIASCTHKWVPTWCDTCELFDICTVCLHRRDCSAVVLSESLASVIRVRYDYWQLLDSTKEANRRLGLEKSIAIKDRQIEFLKKALESKTVLEQPEIQSSSVQCPEAPKRRLHTSDSSAPEQKLKPVRKTYHQLTIDEALAALQSAPEQTLDLSSDLEPLANYQVDAPDRQLIANSSSVLVAPEQTLIQNPKSKIQNPKSKIQNPKSKIQNPVHWVETYSPSTRKNHFYYRYCWMEGRKLHHKHIRGGATTSPKVIALKEAIEKAIADNRSPQYVLEQILTRS